MAIFMLVVVPAVFVIIILVLFVCGFFHDLFNHQYKITLTLFASFAAVVYIWYIGGIYTYSIFVEDDDPEEVRTTNSGSGEAKEKLSKEIRWNKVRKSQVDKSGQTGDMFGGINALFSGLSMILSFGAIIFLIQENRENKSESNERKKHESEKVLIDLALEYVKSFSTTRMESAYKILLFSKADFIEFMYKEVYQENKDEVDRLCDSLRSAIIASIKYDKYHLIKDVFTKLLLVLEPKYLNEKPLNEANIRRSVLKITIPEAYSVCDDFCSVLTFFTVYLTVLQRDRGKLNDVLREYSRTFIGHIIEMIESEENSIEKLSIKYNLFKEYCDFKADGSREKDPVPPLEAPGSETASQVSSPDGSKEKDPVPPLEAPGSETANQISPPDGNKEKDPVPPLEAPGSETMNQIGSPE